MVKWRKGLCRAGRVVRLKENVACFSSLGMQDSERGESGIWQAFRSLLYIIRCLLRASGNSCSSGQHMRQVPKRVVKKKLIVNTTVYSTLLYFFGS